MKYDFTSFRDRRGMDATAVEHIPYPDGTVQDGFSVIPMWVADMNFATAPSIVAAVQKRLEHPLFGYYAPSEQYFSSIRRWQKERNGVEGLKNENIGYENGVLGCVVSALNVLCEPGDHVLVHSPTYVGFTSSVTRAGYQLVHSELKRDENGVWRMDYEDMDRKIKENRIHTAIFCSPHNPCGRVWEREEIEKAMQVYKNNNCFVISDEIWSDIILEGKHIPTQSVSEDARNRTIAIYAPSKTFNLAGFIGSYRIVYNPYLMDRMEDSGKKSGYNHMHVLSQHALIGAYSDEGMEWTDELNAVLKKNVDYAYDYIQTNFAGIDLYKPQGTYMVYLDCTEWCEKNGKTLDELLNAGACVGVIWQDGRPFFHPCSIRMNLAVPYDVLVEAFARLSKYVFNS